MTQLYANVPEELRSLDQWVSWVLAERNDKITKVPMNPNTGEKASSTNPATWGTIEQAIAAKWQHGHDGIGFSFSPDDPHCGVDFDDAVNDDGTIKSWAAAAIRELNKVAYLEVSPSGKGIHAITRATLGKGRKLTVKDADGQKLGVIELYDRGRYFTMTGNRIGDTVIGDGQAQVDDIIHRFDSEKTGSQSKKTGSQSKQQRASGSAGGPYTGSVWATKLTDDEVLDRARNAKNGDKFAALFDEGDLTEYGGDHSLADAALVALLAFFTGPDPQRIDRLFRQSKLMRPKWDEPRGTHPYGVLTIGSVLNKRGGDKIKYYQSFGANAQGSHTPPPPRGISGADLFRKRFAPVRWVVPDRLSEGLYVFAGAPKIGKSWAALDLALAVSTGSPFMEKTVSRAGDVLYLALEDNERRLRSRLVKLWDTDTSKPNPFAETMVADDFVVDFSTMQLPDRLTFWTECPTLDKGGLGHIEKWLTDHPDAALVIIDTLGKLRPQRARGGNAYDEDYAALGGLQRLAAAHKVAIIVVHHLRKGAAEDPLERISGTMGIAGAADGTWVLQRARGAADAELFITGRDIADEVNLAMRFDKETAKWDVLGDAAELARSSEQQEILDVLKAASGPLTPTQVADALGQPRNRIKQRMYYMLKSGLLTNNGGKYSHA